jgi:hypothetical protein
MAKKTPEYFIIYTSMQWLIQAEGSWHMGLENKSPPLFFLSQTFKLSKQDLSVEFFARMSLPPHTLYLHLNIFRLFSATQIKLKKICAL